MGLLHRLKEQLDRAEHTISKKDDRAKHYQNLFDKYQKEEIRHSKYEEELCNKIEKLQQQNKNLQAELNREIHTSHILKQCVKTYATGKFDPNRFEEGDYAYATDIRALDNGDLAKETLKQIEVIE